MYKILLACGAGCSSGLVAQSMRKYAKKKGVKCQIRAVGDAEIVTVISEYDILMLGPHLAYELPKIEDSIEKNGYNTLVKMITKEQYSKLDGESVLKSALTYLEEKVENNKT